MDVSANKERRRRRRAVFYTDVEMFIVCTVPQPPLNQIVPSMLEKPLNAVLIVG
jgi:hypothetical protein